jgi:Fe-S cluster assembly ATPase SufC
MDKFELAFLKCADFVRIFKSLENDFVHVVSAGTVLKKKGRELLAAS